jgi:type I restriction enzyme M protein
MTKPASQKEINEVLWQACDTFRGTLDPTQYKDYILTMLFIKYMSDLWKDKRDQYVKRYDGDEKRVERALGRERFVMPTVELKDKDGNIEESFPASFAALHERRTRSNIGELINIALEAIEDANKAKLEHVFRNIDFNSEPNLGQAKDRNRRLNHLLEDFAKPQLDLRPSRVGNQDVIGNAYEYLISRFAADSGKKGGEFYTPGEVATLLAKLLKAEVRRHGIRSGLRLGLPPHPRRQGNRLRQFRSLRPGVKRLHLGALPHEHVSTRHGQRPDRMV